MRKKERERRVRSEMRLSKAKARQIEYKKKIYLNPFVSLTQE